MLTETKETSLLEKIGQRFYNIPKFMLQKSED